jgi:hypothetical protein
MYKILSSILLFQIIIIKIKVHRTVILSVVLYGCETWSLTFRQESKLKVLGNWVLRKISGSERDEVSGDWRRSHNEGLHELYSSPNFVGVIESRRVEWVGQLAPLGERRDTYRDLVGRSEGNRRRGRPKLSLKDNIKMTQKRNGMGSWTGLILLRTGTSGGVCENDNEISVSIKFGKFLDYLKNY